MQKIQHIQGPWKVVDCRHQKNGQIRIWGRGHIANALASHPQCEANAEFIVRACNVHYELLEALSNMVSCFESASETALDRKVIKAADAAIRKAQSE